MPSRLSDQRELRATRVAGVILECLDEGRADSPPLVLRYYDHMMQDRSPSAGAGRRTTGQLAPVRAGDVLAMPGWGRGSDQVADGIWEVVVVLVDD